MTLQQQMLTRIHELNDQQLLILNEDDREFIVGLAMLIEMGEPIQPVHADRVDKIYKEVLAIQNS